MQGHSPQQRESSERYCPVHYRRRVRCHHDAADHLTNPHRWLKEAKAEPLRNEAKPLCTPPPTRPPKDEPNGRDAHTKRIGGKEARRKRFSEERREQRERRGDETAVRGDGRESTYRRRKARRQSPSSSIESSSEASSIRGYRREVAERRRLREREREREWRIEEAERRRKIDRRLRRWGLTDSEESSSRSSSGDESSRSRRYRDDRRRHNWRHEIRYGRRAPAYPEGRRKRRDSTSDSSSDEDTDRRRETHRRRSSHSPRPDYKGWRFDSSNAARSSSHEAHTLDVHAHYKVATEDAADTGDGVTSVWGKGFGSFERHQKTDTRLNRNASMERDSPPRPPRLPYRQEENVIPRLEDRDWHAPRYHRSGAPPTPVPLRPSFHQSQWNTPVIREASQSPPSTVADIPREPPPSRESFTLNVCLPIEIHEGTICLAGGKGENFYKFSPIEGKLTPASLFFTPDDGVCDCWASFLHIRVARILTVPLCSIDSVLRAFELAMHGTCSEQQFLLESPINVYCKGLADADADDTMDARSEALKRGSLKTQGFLAKAEDYVKFRTLRRRLQFFVTLLYASTDLGYITTTSADSEASFFRELGAEGLEEAKRDLAWMGKEIQKSRRERRGFQPWTRRLRVQFHTSVITEKPISGFPILVNEWREVKKPELEKALAIDTDFINQNIVHGVQVSEIRLEYQLKRTLDPRFPDNLVMTRQLVGMEDPKLWSSAKRQIISEKDENEYPGIARAYHKFIGHFCKELTQTGKHSTSRSAAEAACEGVFSAVEEGQLSAAVVRERALHVFCQPRRLPAVDENIDIVRECMTGKSNFVYRRHLYRKYVLGQGLLLRPTPPASVTS